MVLPRVRRTRPAPAYPDLPHRSPPRSLAPPLESELDRPCYLPSSEVARFTLIRSCAPHVSTSAPLNWPTRWSRTWAVLLPAVEYGRSRTLVTLKFRTYQGGLA